MTLRSPALLMDYHGVSGVPASDGLRFGALVGCYYKGDYSLVILLIHRSPLWGAGWCRCELRHKHRHIMSSNIITANQRANLVPSKSVLSS